MGLAPAEAQKAPESIQKRVEAPAATAPTGPTQSEQDELAAALEELEAEAEAEKRKAGR
jgi:hypothetical protein